MQNVYTATVRAVALLAQQCSLAVHWVQSKQSTFPTGIVLGSFSLSMQYTYDEHLWWFGLKLVISFLTILWVTTNQTHMSGSEIAIELTHRLLLLRWPISQLRFLSSNISSHIPAATWRSLLRCKFHRKISRFAPPILDQRRYTF